MRIIRLVPIIAGDFLPSDIGAARIGKTQGPFCTFQLFGAGTRQVQGCAAGLLQSVSELYRLTQYGMLECCSCSLLLLWPTLDPSPSIVPSFQLFDLCALWQLWIAIIWVISDCFLFPGGAGPNGGVPTTWISQYFCCYSCLGCIRMDSGC
jgi:hypothetical protein